MRRGTFGVREVKQNMAHRDRKSKTVNNGNTHRDADRHRDMIEWGNMDKHGSQ